MGRGDYSWHRIQGSGVTGEGCRGAVRGVMPWSRMGNKSLVVSLQAILSFEAEDGMCYVYIRIILLHVSSPIFIVAELMFYFN